MASVELMIELLPPLIEGDIVYPQVSVFPLPPIIVEREISSIVLLLPPTIDDEVEPVSTKLF